MGRTFVVDENVQLYIDRLCSTNSSYIGVIIGQLTQQRDFVLHMVKTPPAEEQGDKKIELETCDESWVAKHAKQAENMMVGGLTVIGIFAVAPPDALKNAQHKLRQVLFATHKTLSKNTTGVNDDDSIQDRVLLQICSVTRKLTCRTFDVSDNNSSARPAEWKYQSFVERWLSLSCSVSVDVRIPVTTSMGSRSLKRQIQTGLKCTCDSIRKSMGLFNKQLYRDDDLLDSTQHSKKKKSKEENMQQHFDVSLLTQHAQKEASDPVCEDCCAKMLLRGTVQCRALLHNKATAKQALNMLKSDCIRTLIQRCDLLCEDLLSSEEEQDPRILYETPRRVFASLPGAPVPVCDYVFVDETSKESRDRFRELLDIDVEEDSIDMDCESLPSDADLRKPMAESEGETSESDVSLIQASQTAFPYLGMVLGGGVAVLASALSYLYLSDTIP